MRLLTRKIHRAFPELDRYGDEQCERFVRAAAGSVVRRTGRRAACFVLALLPAIIIGLIPFIGGRITSARTVAGAALGVSAGISVLLVLAAPVFFLLWRDVLLRRRVRHVIRARGVCSSCQQNLIGIPVSENNVVTCPECGFACDVDPSLGELVTSDSGHRVFVPQPDTSLRARVFTAARIRRAAKYAAIGLGLLIVLLAVVAGVYELRLRRQAARAAADMPPPNALELLLRQADLLPASEAEPDGLLLMQDAVKAVGRTDSRVWRTTPVLTSDGREVMPDPSSIGFERQSDRSESQKIYDDAAEALSRRLNEEYGKDGLYDVLDQLTRARKSSTSHTPAGAAARDLGALRNIARINAGRMIIAVERDDPREFERAYEACLAIGRLLRQQPALIDSLVGIAIEALGHNHARRALRTRHSAPWLDAISGPLARQEREASISIAFEGERFFGLTQLSSIFADPSNVRFGVLSPRLRVMMGGPPSLAQSVGSYERNKTEYNRTIDAVAGASKLDPYLRAPATNQPQSSLVILDLIAASFRHSLRSQDQIEVDRRGMLVIVALERYRLDHANYPESLDVLVPTYIAQLPADPWSGAKFGYKLIDQAKDPAERGYLLYSVAADRTDNGGQSPLGPARRSYQCLDPANITIGDFIINDAE